MLKLNLEESKICLFGKGLRENVCIFSKFNTLPNDRILAWSKFKAFADDKINMTKKLTYVMGLVRNIVGKVENATYLAFSPFPTMFSKAFFFRVVKSRDCLVKI